MSKVNRGKQFEQQVFRGFSEQPDTNIIRLYDTMSGFRGNANICDFIVYSYPTQFFIECKSCYGATLNFKSQISKRQWEGLLEVSNVPGVRAGFLVWFIDYNDTIWVSIERMEYLRSQNFKSLNYHDTYSEWWTDMSHKSRDGFSLDATKRRVLFDYDMKSFLKKVGGCVG